MVRVEISVWNVTYIPVTYKPKIDGQTFWLILLALNIRANERETVTYKHVTYKPKGVYIVFLKVENMKTHIFSEKSFIELVISRQKLF